MGCALSALGIICALGSGKEKVRQNLKRTDLSHLARDTTLIAGKEALVAAVTTPLPEIPSTLIQFRSRNNRLILAAFHEIETEVTEVVKRYGRERVGVVIGSSTSGIAEGERAVHGLNTQGSFPGDYRYAQQELGNAADFLATIAGITGPAYTISTACSSGAKSMVSGRLLLESGMCDAVIVGGADSLCKLTLNGFSALELRSETPCNPFSKNRSGITVGEGAALFVMTRDDAGIQLLGAGESSDAYHLSTPDPEGRGALLSMQLALKEAGLKPSDILYISMHGTGTLHNDQVEALAVSHLFPPSTFCSSLKPLVGHTLGASGAISAAALWMLLHERGEFIELPTHHFDGWYDPALPPLRLVQSAQRVPRRGGEALLCNSFAFGGNNCSLILGEARS